MSDLRDAHVLVVGATGGLGSAIARALAAAGARLTLHGRNTGRLADLGAELGAHEVPGDLVDPATPARLVGAAVARADRLDGVIFAAGVVAFGELTDLDDDVLDQLMLVNLLAPIRLARAAAGALPAGGYLAMISAVVAEHPMKGMAAYSATKTGLTGFDAAIAGELRRRKIRVIDIRPPHAETGLATRPIAGTAPRLGRGIDPGAVAARVVRAITGDETDLPAAAFTA